MFGIPFHADDQIIRPLESQGLKRLYPLHFDHKKELKKLNHSILINFLDLLEILITAPDSNRRSEKLEDLKLLFIHIHHLINEFRPHQARETLRVMMEIQKKQRIETAERFYKHFEVVKEKLQECVASLPDEMSLDTKLIIKTEPSDGITGSGLGFKVKVKTEPNDNDSEPEISTKDQMMCDIVDAIN